MLLFPPSFTPFLLSSSEGKSTIHLIPPLIQASLFQRDSNIPTKVNLYTHTHIHTCARAYLRGTQLYLLKAFLFWNAHHYTTMHSFFGCLEMLPPLYFYKGSWPISWWRIGRTERRKMSDCSRNFLLTYLSIIPCMLTLPSNNLPALEASCQTHFSIPSSKCLVWR